MTHRSISQITRALSISTLVVIACASTQVTNARIHGGNVRLNSGTVIAVKLDNELSSNNSSKGDKFTATIKETSRDSDPNGLPAGTQVSGVVRLAQPKTDKKPGALDLSFQRLIIPNGRSYSLDGSLIGLDNKSVSRGANGRITARASHRTDRLTYVGYGAGAGLLVNVLTHRKGTLTDTAIGAGLGYLFGSLVKGKSKVNDVSLKEGTEMGVRLNSRLTFNNNSN